MQYKECVQYGPRSVGSLVLSFIYCAFKPVITSAVLVTCRTARGLVEIHVGLSEWDGKGLGSALLGDRDFEFVPDVSTVVQRVRRCSRLCCNSKNIKL